MERRRVISQVWRRRRRWAGTRGGASPMRRLISGSFNHQRLPTTDALLTIIVILVSPSVCLQAAAGRPARDAATTCRQSMPPTCPVARRGQTGSIRTAWPAARAREQATGSAGARGLPGPGSLAEGAPLTPSTSLLGGRPSHVDRDNAACAAARCQAAAACGCGRAGLNEWPRAPWRKGIGPGSRVVGLALVLAAVVAAMPCAQSKSISPTRRPARR